MPPAAAPVFSLRHIAGSLVLLSCACLVAAAAIYGATTQERQARQALQRVQSQQNEARTRLARASDDEREIRSRISRYQDIIQRGLLQPEQRLQWIEMLKAIQGTRRLFDLNYEIAPQKPLETARTAGYLFLVSGMKLDLPLLHEEDLLGLLDDMSRQSRALIKVNQCRITRLPVGTARSANLQAACEIDWIKLQEQP